MSQVFVQRLMVADVFVISPAMTVKEAIHLLITKKISGAPVVDTSNRV